jgi:hypothetical protein
LKKKSFQGGVIFVRNWPQKWLRHPVKKIIRKFDF